MGEEYWSLGRGVAVRNGWTCRECRKPIYKGEPIVSRDGRKIRMFYHVECFSGDSDPRTQSGASANEGRLPASCFSASAPAKKGSGKWSTGSYGYAPDPEAEQAASKAGSCAVSRTVSRAVSTVSSSAISRDERDGKHVDRGAAMAGNVMKMAAMRLEGLAESQTEEEGGTGKDDGSLKEDTKTSS